MNKRLWRKQEKAHRKEIHDLLDAVLDINGISKRKREITGDLPTAFFDFSGHIATAEVQVYKTGWDSDNRADFREEAHLYDAGAVASLACRLKDYVAGEGLLK